VLEQMGIAARAASYRLALLSSREKNRVLESIADALEAQHEAILRANADDLADARAAGLSEAMLDRLALTPARLKAIADDVRQVCGLADPVGQVIDGGLLDSGLRLERRRVPLGVIGVIYEARPNVTVDVAALCLKTATRRFCAAVKRRIVPTPPLCVLFNRRWRTAACRQPRFRPLRTRIARW
jgi:glutamate-5-semialdehyde dehydrogenase